MNNRIQNQMLDLHKEVHDVCGVETEVQKKLQRIEFMTGMMGKHQHTVSLIEKDGKISGTTERKLGHVHKVDLSIQDGEVLGYTGSTDGHKHIMKYKMKIKTKKEKEK